MKIQFNLGNEKKKIGAIQNKWLDVIIELNTIVACGVHHTS